MSDLPDASFDRPVEVINQPGAFYRLPEYYDVVFGDDWEAEYDFLIEAFCHHADGTVWSVFEPACGTGRLLFRLGLFGYEVSGSDLTPAMIEYCNDRLRSNGLPASAFVGDMCNIRLAKPVDAAFNMINTFRHLLTEEQAVAHLTTLARAVRPGGIYVLGLHLTPTKGPSTESETWSATRGDVSVQAHLQFLSRDDENRLEYYQAIYDVRSPREAVQIRDEVAFRLYRKADFLRLLDQCSMWGIEAVYDFSYDIDSPLELTDESEDVVFILKRRPDETT